MADAKRDWNYNPTILGVSSTDNTQTVPLKINPVTGRVLVQVDWAWSWDVVWPVSSIDSAIVLFSWITWKLIKDSAKTVATTLWTTDATLPTSKAVNDAISWFWVWDMLKATYDPNNKNWDAFSQDNMVDWTTNKNYTATEKTKLAWIATGADVSPVSSVAWKTWVVTLVKWDVWLWNVVNADTTTTANITDSTNKRFVTDAQQTVIWNTSWTNSWDETTATIKTKLWTASTSTDWYLTSTDWNTFNNKEPAITKNTWFNKNLWTTAWTVSEWNHTHSIYEASLWNPSTDWDILSSTVAWVRTWITPASWWGWWIETVKISWQQVAWTYFFEYIADWAKTVWNIVIALQVANTWAAFTVKCYKNWVDLAKDIIIADWWWTAVNGRYKASLDIAEALVADDVFELEINTVWSTVSWSEFSALINIS